MLMGTLQPLVWMPHGLSVVYQHSAEIASYLSASSQSRKDVVVREALAVAVLCCSGG